MKVLVLCKFGNMQLASYGIAMYVSIAIVILNKDKGKVKILDFITTQDVAS